MTAAIPLPFQEFPYEQGRQCFERIAEYLDSAEACFMTHSELERELEKKGRELMRVMLQEHLDRRGPGQCEQTVCGADGVERTRKRSQRRNLETVFGTVTATRTGYGKEGVESLHPSDAELNLPDEKYSHELCRRASLEAANISFDETRESMDKNTAGHIPKRQIEEQVRRAAWDFDPFYERRRCDPLEDGGTGSLLVISVDGKGIVLHEKDLREQTRRAAENRTHKMERRLSKGEKKNAKRMATVATVFTTEPFKRTPEDLVAESGCKLNKEKRPPPERKRVWASIEKTTEKVVEEAFCEACHRDPNREKQWVALVDGNKSQIRILRGKAKEKGIELTIIVDIIHVIEYLWKAGKAFHSESGPELENWVRHRLLKVLCGKAGLVAGGMRRSATRQGLKKNKRKPVDICANCLLNQSSYLHYDHYLSQGFPIATGVIEGACRHLVKDRMELTGAKWSLIGAEAILRLRALRSSHDFDEYWEFHETCEYKRNHQERYAGGIVPPTVDSHQFSKQGLKVIK